MKRRAFIKVGITSGVFVSFIQNDIAKTRSPQNSSYPLENGFVNPPSFAKPHVFWFWMNGNISKEGITLDLEAMQRVGIGGVFNFDAGTGIPKGPVQYLSDEWLELKKHAIKEAERLGLDFTMHNCPGWSSSGGPWVTPELAMQQFTWSEIYVSGGTRIKKQLPKPFNKLNYYRDVVVLAFPSLKGEALLQNFIATSNNGFINSEQLTGEDAKGVIVKPSNIDETGWLQIEFNKPFEARSVTFLISANTENEKTFATENLSERSSVDLECSDDGIQFKKITTINTGTEYELKLGYKFITYDITFTKAKYFRFVSKKPRRFSQVRFSEIIRLKNFMEKANYRFMFTGDEASNIYSDLAEDVPHTSIVDTYSILDITNYVNKDGVLHWSAPQGDWTILRIGYTPLGTMNHAAPDTGVGLECDKFSKAAFDFHFNKMMGNLLPALKSLAEQGKVGLEIDSYEAYMQNWTEKLPEEFEKRRKYNLLKYLPALTGRIVDCNDITERFLWDFRRTQADLIAENYYGRFQQLCHQHKITSFIQPYDKGPFEEMQIGSKVDVNIGEYWYGLSSILQGNLRIYRTPKLVASIAHTNDQKIVGAEVFTSEPESSRWQEYPFAMKPLADKVFIKGVNKIIIHRFAHQPHPTAVPGMTMGPWGIQFDRTNTWWNEGKEWINYLSRCQYLLQQGFFVSNLLYFTGEEASVYTRVNSDELIPTPPKGYDYDLINAEVILKDIAIGNEGVIYLNGMEYRVLVLQSYKAITLELLYKLQALIKQGMILVGARPERSLGLKDYRNNEKEFNQIADELWGNIDGTVITENNVGKGKVFWGKSLESIFQQQNIQPDFEYTSKSGDAPIQYIHRKTNDAHFYFISNQRRSYEELVCTFRIKNLQPELWDAVTGKIIPLKIYQADDDRIRVPVQLEPYGSRFVVFRKQAEENRLHFIIKDSEPIVDTRPFQLSPRKLFNNVQNNFTITFWAKPEMNVMLNESNQMEGIKNAWTDYYAIYPSSGKECYGEGHATCGLTVGRNGVAVWEHEDKNPVLVLSATTAISGWTHIGLVYEEGAPAVYVNGKLIQKGKRSASIVHPASGEAYIDEGASYYNGDMSKPQLFYEVLSDDKISQLASEATPAPSSSPFIIEPFGEKEPGLLIWQNGHYKLKNNHNSSLSFHVSNIEQPLRIEGPWQLNFPPYLGVQGEIILPDLISLHIHPEEGVKYFSGTVTYTKSFSIRKTAFTKDKLFFMDLGRVEIIAQINLNGKDLGILWKRPYRAEITNAIKPGINHLIIKVTNQWVNRLIGDEQLPDPNKFFTAEDALAFESIVGGGIEQLPEWYIHQKPKPSDGRITFATWKHYTQDSPLIESGLIGPVTIYTAALKSIKSLINNIP